MVFACDSCLPAESFFVLDRIENIHRRFDALFYCIPPEKKRREIEINELRQRDKLPNKVKLIKDSVLDIVYKPGRVIQVDD